MSQARIGNLYVRLAGDTSALDASLEAAVDKVSRAGERMVSVGTSLTKGLTAPIVAVGAAAFTAAIRVGNAADKLLDMEQMTGIAVERLQEFRRVATIAGVETDTLGTAAMYFSQRLSGVGEESEKVQKALDLLGLKARDGSGALRSMDDMLPEVITSLQGIEDVTQRNAVAYELFGRRSRDLAPILGMTTEEFNAAREEAHALGLVLDRYALEAANAFRIQWDSLRETLGASVSQIGLAVLPVMEDLVGLMQDHIVPAVQAVIGRLQEVDPQILKAAAAFAAVAAAVGPFLVVLGKLLTMKPLLIAGFKAVVVAIGLLTSPIAIVVAAVAGLIIVWVKWGDEIKAILGAVWDALKKWAAAIAKPIKQALDPILDLAASWIAMWTEIITFLALLLRVVGEKLAEIVRVAFYWLVDRLSPVAERVMTVLQPIIDFVSRMNDRIREILRDLLGAMYDIFVGGITRVAGAVRDQIDRITGFFGGLKDRLVGNSIIPEMVDGISDNFDRMATVMGDFSTQAVTAVNTSFDGMADSLEESGARVGDTFDSMLDRASEAVGNIGSLFEDFGLDFPKEVTKVVDSVKENWGKIKGAFELPFAETMEKLTTDWWAMGKLIVDVFKWIWNRIGSITKALARIGFSFAAATPQMGQPWQPGAPGVGVGVTTVQPVEVRNAVEIKNLGQLEQDSKEKIKLLGSMDRTLTEIRNRLTQEGGVSAAPAVGISLSQTDAALGETVVRTSRLLGGMEVAL